MTTGTNFYEALISGEFASMVRESTKGKKISNSQELYNIMKPLITQVTDQEQGWFLFLDSKNQIIAIEKLFTGTLTCSQIYPREIIKKIISHEAAAIIMCHNHPSGDPEPSPDDMAITKRIMVACTSIGATMHEHIIIGDGGRFMSMADRGRITQIRNDVERFIETTA